MARAPRGGRPNRLTSAGGIPYAANLFAQGYTESEVEALAERRWPQEPLRSVQAVVRAGLLAWQAGSRMEVQGADETLPASEVPGYSPGKSGYRYTTYSVFRDPRSGDERGIYYQYTSPTALSLAELDRAITAYYQLESARRRRARGESDLPPDAVLTSTSVYSVERAYL